MILDNIIEGMLIIQKYSKDDQYCVHAEHDQVFCGSFDLPLTWEEKKTMVELGWFGDQESWSFFS